MSADRDHSTDVRSEHVMLDLGPDVGALVLLAAADLHGAEIEVSPAECDDQRSHKQVHERPAGGRQLYAAVFDRLPVGDYTIWLDGRPLRRDVAVVAAAVTDISIEEDYQ